MRKKPVLCWRIYALVCARIRRTANRRLCASMVEKVSVFVWPYIPIYTCRRFFFSLFYLFLFFFSFSNTPIPHAIVFLSRASAFSPCRKGGAKREETRRIERSRVEIFGSYSSSAKFLGRQWAVSRGITSERIGFDPMLQ